MSNLSDRVSADLSVRRLHLTPKGDRTLSIQPTSDRTDMILTFS